jgi:AcrR family transcriptional regulator
MAEQSAEDEPKRERFRDRHRRARRDEFLEAAQAIVNSEGVNALTMARVTGDTGSSEGSIYTYFASKDALLAELETHALQRLHDSLRDGLAALDRHLEAVGAAPDAAALARVVGTSRFWIESERNLPSEIELSRRLLAGDNSLGETTAPSDDVLATMFALLSIIANQFDAAQTKGVLSPGDTVARSLMSISSITGVLLTSKLGSWGEMFEGRGLAGQFIDDLLTGWGADPELLAVADQHVSDFLAAATIAPPPPPLDT